MDDKKDMNSPKGNLNNTLKNRIREFIRKDCFINKEFNGDALEFGFDIRFPNFTNENGEQKGFPLAITKKKEKDYIRISFSIVLHETDFKILKEMDNKVKIHLKQNLETIALRRNVFYNIHPEKNLFRFIDKLYIFNNQLPSINEFYNSLKNILNTQLLVNRAIGMGLPNLIVSDEGNKGSLSMFG
ncbi:MAG: DUF2299 family protein [Candidatus Hermodarchaeota archaeon]